MFFLTSRETPPMESRFYVRSQKCFSQGRVFNSFIISGMEKTVHTEIIKFKTSESRWRPECFLSLLIVRFVKCEISKVI